MINEKNSNNNINYMSFEQIKSTELSRDQIFGFNPDMFEEVVIDYMIDTYGHILAERAVSGEEFLKMCEQGDLDV